MSTIEPTGHVPASSQRTSKAFKMGQGSMKPLVGIVYSVKPCDDASNALAQTHPLLRGARHEALVYAAVAYGQPDVPLPHVVIPPRRHSGIDNTEEDVPRGVSSNLIDGEPFNPDLSELDYTKLDGEWCVVDFINGHLDYPYIQSWWPHPSNNFDLMTSGQGDEGNALTQVDLTNNVSPRRYRFNGVEQIISKNGDVYLDTTQAKRRVQVVSGLPQISQVEGGGSVQLDVKAAAQLEFNFNVMPETGPRIGAGSSSANPVHEVDRFHPEQAGNITGTPAARETGRTYFRMKAYETLLKSSDFQIYCQDTAGDGGSEGSFLISAQDNVFITQQPADGSRSAASISISGDDGSVALQTTDGTMVTLSEGQVVVINAAGTMISVQDGAITLSAADGVSVACPLAVTSDLTVNASSSLGLLATEPAVLGNLLATAFATFAQAMVAAVPTVPEAAVTKVDLVDATADLASDVAAALSSQVTLGA